MTLVDSVYGIRGVWRCLFFSPFVVFGRGPGTAASARARRRVFRGFPSVKKIAAVPSEDSYEAAMAVALVIELEDMDEGGAPYPSRESLYDRPRRCREPRVKERCAFPWKNLDKASALTVPPETPR